MKIKAIRLLKEMNHSEKEVPPPPVKFDLTQFFNFPFYAKEMERIPLDKLWIQPCAANCMGIV